MGKRSRSAHVESKKRLRHATESISKSTRDEYLDSFSSSPGPIYEPLAGPDAQYLPSAEHTAVPHPEDHSHHGRSPRRAYSPGHRSSSTVSPPIIARNRHLAQGPGYSVSEPEYYSTRDMPVDDDGLTEGYRLSTAAQQGSANPSRTNSRHIPEPVESLPLPTGDYAGLATSMYATDTHDPFTQYSALALGDRYSSQAMHHIASVMPGAMTPPAEDHANPRDLESIGVDLSSGGAGAAVAEEEYDDNSYDVEYPSWRGYSHRGGAH